jgi:hypothetical protein
LQFFFQIFNFGKTVFAVFFFFGQFSSAFLADSLLRTSLALADLANAVWFNLKLRGIGRCHRLLLDFRYWLFYILWRILLENTAVKIIKAYINANTSRNHLILLIILNASDAVHTRNKEITVFSLEHIWALLIKLKAILVYTMAFVKCRLATFHITS